MAKTSTRKKTSHKLQQGNAALTPIIARIRTNPHAARQQLLHYLNKGQHAQALPIAQAAIHLFPASPDPWNDAAVCYVGLQDWPNTIKHALKSLALKPNQLNMFDALSHAYGSSADFANATVYGTQALKLREAQLQPVMIDSTFTPAPIKPFNSTEPQRNIIAFSLYGAKSKYCETAVLNALEQPRLYPHWRCRFYVDSSVPTTILERIRAAGAEVMFITAEQATWPGPMWRFAAYDDPTVDRILFRDADSVISEREVGAVNEWLLSDKHVHLMRDSGSHTELILAGLWGVTASAIPPMQQLIAHYLQKPPASAHYADQLFLRHYIWPFAKHSFLQHDSLFAFLESKPFPEGPKRTDFHVGYAEGSPLFSVPVRFAVGTAVKWQLWRNSPPNPTLICSYPTTVLSQQVISDNIPARYAEGLQSGAFKITVSE